jgi:hypothetical protein
MRTLGFAACIACLVAVAGCEQEGPAEKAGKEIDQTIEKAGEKAEETRDEIEEELDDEDGSGI